MVFAHRPPATRPVCTLGGAATGEALGASLMGGNDEGAIITSPGGGAFWAIEWTIS